MQSYIENIVNGLRRNGAPLKDIQVMVGTLCHERGWNLEETLTMVEGYYHDAIEATLSTKINEWVYSTRGWFGMKQLDTELDIRDKTSRNNRRFIIHKLATLGVIETDGNRNGIYRIVDNRCPEIKWQDADANNVLDLKWPFELEEYVNLYPKNIVVIAGAPNAGKTALIYNFIKLNMADFPVHLFSSEVGAEELKLRLCKFDFPIDQWKFDARERSRDFASVIYPDEVNVIDYLEIKQGEFYLVGDQLAAIHDKLRNGIAVVAIQKKKNTKFNKYDLGRGAELGLEKARLYLSIDGGRLIIVKGKNWRYEEVNPNGVTFEFSLINGGSEFINISEVAE